MLNAMSFCESATACFDLELAQEYHESINEDVELFATVVTINGETTIDIEARNSETETPIECATCDYLDEDDFFRAVEYVINCFVE